MELMRHESIETTLTYYVGRNAERTAAALWEHSPSAKPASESASLDNFADHFSTG
jgi:hypothetical protein